MSINLLWDANLKVLAGLFVHVGRAQDAINALLGRQRHRTANAGSCALGCVDDLVCRFIEQPVIVGLQPNANSLYFSRSGGCIWFRCFGGVPSAQFLLAISRGSATCSTTLLERDILDFTQWADSLF